MKAFNVENKNKYSTYNARINEVYLKQIYYFGPRTLATIHTCSTL